MDIKVVLIYHASVRKSSKTPDFKTCFFLIYREQVPSYMLPALKSLRCH